MASSRDLETVPSEPRETQILGRWNDPNPATQMVARDIEHETQEVREFQKSSNLHNPIFHHDLQRAYKNAANLEYAFEGEHTDEIYDFFTIPETGNGENPHEEHRGLNPIVNENRAENQLRFQGSLFVLPRVGKYEPVGTQKTYEQTSTIWDKKEAKPSKSKRIDPQLLPAFGGLASLRADVQNSINADDLNVQYPTIGLYNDLTPTSDEVLQNFKPPKLTRTSKLDRMSQIYKSYKKL